MMMQLMPARDGAVLTDSCLAANNAADLESNRILWRHQFWPATTDAITFDVQPVSVAHMVEVDIKSKRRFDRALWALVLSLTSETTSQNDHFTAIDLRGYFKAADAL